MSFKNIICHINVRIGWTICGILLGIFWSLVYIISFKNWSALAMSLTSTIFAFETLFLYFSFKKDTILKWKPSTFHYLFWTNLIIAIISLFGMIACIILAACWKQGMAPSDQYGENLWSTSTWCLILFKWTFQNVIFARIYGKKVRKVYAPDIQSIGADHKKWKY